jgi:hypothetical protein
MSSRTSLMLHACLDSYDCPDHGSRPCSWRLPASVRSRAAPSLWATCVLTSPETAAPGMGGAMPPRQRLASCSAANSSATLPAATSAMRAARRSSTVKRATCRACANPRLRSIATVQRTVRALHAWSTARSRESARCPVACARCSRTGLVRALYLEWRDRVSRWKASGLSSAVPRRRKPLKSCGRGLPVVWDDQALTDE